MELDFSKVKRNDEFSEIEVRYATPEGTRVARGMGMATTLENDESVMMVVDREDKTYTIPHERVFEIVSVEL
jgi:hypothetical protein